MQRIIQAALPALLLPLLLCPVVSVADDTEVFFSRAATQGNRAANVLFMFDISGSMGNLDGEQYRRIDRVKQAMVDILETTDNVNMGIGAFNGTYIGGSILVPSRDPNEDICENASCDEVTIRVPIKSPTDDAEQRASGDIDLTSSNLDFGSVDSKAGTNSQMVGLRFADVDVPRGATINHAVVEMTPLNTDHADTNLSIRGQAIGHAPTFEALNGNIGGRTLTTTQVDWNVESWSNTKYEFPTPDIGSVVQEIVNRADWCGGNALALVFDGTGERSARSRDRDPWEVPVLKVSYDPGTVSQTTTCISKRAGVAVSSDTDDAEENATVVSTTTNALDPNRDGGSATLGFRFRGLDVPPNAKVSSAYLKLVTETSDASPLTLRIRVQPTAGGSPFDASIAGDISDRTASATELLWTVPEAANGDRLTSVDIGPLIESLVATSGWSAGSAVVVTLSTLSGAGVRRFYAFDAGEDQAARLEVRYQREAATSSAEPIVLRTARDEMLDTIMNFRYRGGTPINDAFLESALYMLGKPVDFGRKRGNQSGSDRYFRVSAPSTYSGGTLFTPPGCTDVNPNAVACLDEEITGSAVYDAPVPGTCQANQIVLLSDGAATTGNAESQIQSLIGTGSCATRANSRENCGVELAEWLYDPDSATQDPIITHTIGFNFSSDFLRDIATAGGGRFQTADSASQLASVFRNLVNEAADVDTGFVAPAATVSQFNRFANREDVYFAMFKPSLSARWDGNLKRYRLGKHPDTGEVDFYDSTSMTPILDRITGGIRNSAKSYWTDGDADGPRVSAGGAANELVLPRNILTYVEDMTGIDPVRTLVALHEDTDAITAELLGIDGNLADYRTLLLKWARGVDVLDIDDDQDVSEVRHQMGDPMHSTPFVMNYDTDGTTTPESVVFVGTNEGYLHAIDTEDGSEVFGLVPPELLGNLDRFYRNEIGTNRPYGLDGPIGGYFDDLDGDGLVDTGETAIVYVGMRRGGRNYYAVNVTDPANPSIAWVIKGGQGDFVELGQTWSRPIVTTVLDGSDEREVLVFGGGYDPANDTRLTRNVSTGGGQVGNAVDGAVAQADSMGRAIFVVDAYSGAYRTHLAAPDWSDMEFAIPSDPAVLDIDLDGFADMIWVGDMGGQLWRFDISGAAGTALESSITGAAVASFSSIGVRGNRRFFNTPDVALLRDANRKVFLNVGIGSGWRAHPLDDGVEDRFYMLRDDALFGPPRDADGDIDYPSLVEDDLYDVTGRSVRDDTTGKSAKGWYLSMERDGEKILGPSVTVNSQVFFSSYVPDAGSNDDCSASIGGGRLYGLSALYGDAALDPDGDVDDDDSVTGEEVISVELDLRGLPPPVEVFLPKDAPDKVIGSVGSDVFDTNPGPARRRTYWAEQ